MKYTAVINVGPFQLVLMAEPTDLDPIETEGSEAASIPGPAISKALPRQRGHLRLAVGAR